MNSLKLLTPSWRTSVFISPSVPGLASSRIMCAPTSTQAVSRNRCQSSSALNGLWPGKGVQKSTSVVVPPNAAARVPLPKVSMVCAVDVAMSRWVCTSTPPGSTSRPAASWISTSPPTSRCRPIVTMRPSSTRMSAT